MLKGGKRNRGARNMEQEEQDDLIPGLVRDLAILCLIRVSRVYHSTMKAVCRSWRNLVTDEDSMLYTQRQEHGLTEVSVLQMKAKRKFPTEYLLETEETHLSSGKIAKGKHVIKLNRGQVKKRPRNKIKWTKAVWAGGATVSVVSDWPENSFLSINMLKGTLKTSCPEPNEFIDKIQVVDRVSYILAKKHFCPPRLRRYNLHENSWTSLPDIPASFWMMESVVVSGELMVLGESRGERYCLVYSPESDSWNDLGEHTCKKLSEPFNLEALTFASRGDTIIRCAQSNLGPRDPDTTEFIGYNKVIMELQMCNMKDGGDIQWESISMHAWHLDLRSWMIQPSVTVLNDGKVLVLYAQTGAHGLSHHMDNNVIWVSYPYDSYDKGVAQPGPIALDL